MAFTGRLRGIIFIAIGALVGAVLIGHPAQGAISTVTGTVSSSNGPVASGLVAFFATCEDYEDFHYAAYGAYDYFNGRPYSVTVPDGTYRVGIRPDNGTGAGASWHSAKPTCDQADVVTVSGNSTLNLVSLPGSDVTGTVRSSNGPVTHSAVYFYATCQAFEHGHGEYAGSARVNGGNYTVTLPNGTYRAYIDVYRVPLNTDDPEAGAVSSWHKAKPTCDQADVITVSGNTTQDLLATAGFAVTGRVSSSNGPVYSGRVAFFTTCQAYEQGDRAAAATDFEVGGPYSVTVAAGSYRVWISPDDGFGALKSWHKAKPTCDQAAVVTVSGNTTQDLRALPAKHRVKKPPADLKQGKTAALATRSSEGIRVTWKSITKKVCRVDKGPAGREVERKAKVKGLRKGKCVLRASTSATRFLPAYSRKFTIRVK